MSGNWDAWTDRLSEYVDDELAADERAALDMHLQVCGDCARTVNELRGVVRRAVALESRLPAEDLWPAIEARLAPAPRARALDLGAWLGAWRRREARAWQEAVPRRWSFTFPQL